MYTDYIYRYYVHDKIWYKRFFFVSQVHRKGVGGDSCGPLEDIGLLFDMYNITILTATVMMPSSNYEDTYCEPGEDVCTRSHTHSDHSTEADKDKH